MFSEMKVSGLTPNRCSYPANTLPTGQAGYAVYKSIPYGSLEEVIPYLIRRAQENRSVLHGARREQKLLSQELRRRLLGRGRRVPH